MDNFGLRILLANVCLCQWQKCQTSHPNDGQQMLIICNVAPHQLRCSCHVSPIHLLCDGGSTKERRPAAQVKKLVPAHRSRYNYKDMVRSAHRTWIPQVPTNDRTGTTGTNEGQQNPDGYDRYKPTNTSSSTCPSSASLVSCQNQ